MCRQKNALLFKVTQCLPCSNTENRKQRERRNILQVIIVPPRWHQLWEESTQWRESKVVKRSSWLCEGIEENQTEETCSSHSSLRFEWDVERLCKKLLFL